jgi:hypothetical protein
MTPAGIARPVRHFVVEQPARGRTRNRRGGHVPRKLEQRRWRDDGVGLELEGVQRQRLGWQTQQIGEHGLLHARVIRLLRPTQRLQQARRIEDAAARALGPISFHQTDHVHVVELAEAGGDGVHEMDAGVTAPWRERLRLR